jgi:hypothetical protein
MDKIIQKSEIISLSGEDLLKIAPNTKILSYTELRSYTSIDQLLSPHEAVIILYELEINVGHWVSLFKKDTNTLEFFDSYGLSVDEELKFAKENTRIHKGQELNHLSFLIQNSGYGLIENKVQLQKNLEDINTCGRYAAYRILHRHLPLDVFNKLLTENKHYNPDFWISVATFHLTDHVYDFLK